MEIRVGKLEGYRFKVGRLKNWKIIGVLGKICPKRQLSQP
jgi:hypothetical protein